MPDPALVSHLVHFGTFEVDLRSGELRKHGLKVKIQEQPLQVLAMLLEHPGQIITREDLRKKLWPADTFVDFEHGLNAAINKLRETLGDSAENPRFVETLHRRGYRFITPVEIMGAQDAAPAVAPVSSPAIPVAAMSPSPVGELPLPSAAAETAQLQQAVPHRKRWIWVLGASIGLIVASAVFTYVVTRPLAHPKVLGYVQITNDGRMKDGIVTDGSRLYFTATSAGPPAIYEVSANGGEAVPFAPAFRDATVADISPKGDELLVVTDLLTGRGPMWTLSLPGASIRRIGDLHAGAWYLAAGATWSPDGKTIAYVDSDDVYTADSDGSHSRKLMSFAGTSRLAYRIRWSPDGNVLRFSLADAQKGLSIWEVAPDGSNPHRLIPEGTAPDQSCCGNWTPDGKYFVFSGDESLWAIREERGWFRRSRGKPVKLTNGPMSFLWPAASKDGKKLFAIGRLGRGELVRYDAKKQGLFPYLSGISAEGISFSRDRAWVAYVMYPEGMLWRSRVDGSERLQLSFPPNFACLPHWSPNGKQIAFVVRSANTYKLNLISADGGSAEELLPDYIEEASWLPDGQSLLFGRNPPWVNSTSKDPIGIYALDLRTRQVSFLPGTEGLITPQLSPNGHFVVAGLAHDETRLVLYNLDTHSKSDLAKTDSGVVSVGWSKDGRYYYFATLGETRAVIFRVQITTRVVERVGDLKNMKLVNTANGYWFGLAPDDSPLFVRDVGSQEIYALDWEAP
jgi:Tol biopolymer transport system component/DNA-binding winged helix-turn-helix (wHTH) protein